MCRWFCLAVSEPYTVYMDFFSLTEHRKFLIFQCIVLRIFFLHALLIDSFPSGTYNCFSICCKSLSCCLCFKRSLLIFKCRIKHTQEPTHDHIIYFAFFVRHMIELYKLFRRNDCMMVTDLFIIHKASVCLNRFADQYSGKLSVRACSTGFQTFFNRRYNILSDIT